MKRKVLLATMFAVSLTVSSSFAMDRPITIKDQGSFTAGGVTVTAPGTYAGNTKPTDPAGKTLHGDHAYVFYQIPMKAQPLGMVFLHGYGQSGKTWESTPDGRDGFQNIFLAKGFSTYVVDQPRRGRAGRSTVPGTISAVSDDQLWFNNFRIGQWPHINDNVQVPRDQESQEQFFHSMTPDTGAFDSKVVSDAMVAVFEKSGNGVLVTHSAGGGPGWETAMKTNKVKGVIALEPGTFPFPIGEVPETEATSSPFPARPMTVPMADFMKLTKIPIIVYFGDNIPTEPSTNWGEDNWRVRVNLAKKWAAVVNKYGGDVSIVSLPDIGIKGNTHFMMADLNNGEVANAMEKWMKAKGLAK